MLYVTTRSIYMIVVLLKNEGYTLKGTVLYAYAPKTNKNQQK